MLNEEKWKRDFLRKLSDAVSRFNDETLAQRSRSHCADFKMHAAEHEAYAAEVGKLSVTAVQLLAVSSPTATLQKDLPYFRAEYVNLFVMRNELQGRTNDAIEKKLQGTRGAGGGFYKIYDAIKSRGCTKKPLVLKLRLANCSPRSLAFSQPQHAQ